MSEKAVAVVSFWDYGVGNMKIIGMLALTALWEENSEYRDAKNVSIFKDGNVVFNIVGSQYRFFV